MEGTLQYNLQRLLFTEVVWPISQFKRFISSMGVPKLTVHDKLPYYKKEGMTALPDIRLRVAENSKRKTAKVSVPAPFFFFFLHDL
jgi:hypothetical protein